MGNESYVRIIENLRDLIKASGLKQNVIAERCGKDPKTFSNIMNFRQRLSVEDIDNLCEVLGTTPNQIYFGQPSAC